MTYNNRIIFHYGMAILHDLQCHMTIPEREVYAHVMQHGDLVSYLANPNNPVRVSFRMLFKIAFEQKQITQACRNLENISHNLWAIFQRDEYERSAANRWWFETTFLNKIKEDLFHQEPFDESWINAYTTSMVRAIYDDQDWGLLGILGDCLEEAGCTNERILTHCRDGGVHYRGCYVVEALLGNSRPKFGSIL